MNPDTNPLNPFGAPTGIQTPVQAPQPAPQPTQPATQVASTVDPFVRQGQTFLSANGFNPGPIDGLMGPKTSAGIQAFQTSAGLPTTGQFDQATRNAIANFKPEPVPMPTISNQVDVTQLEAPAAQPITPAQPQPSAFGNITAGIESYLSNLDKRISDLNNQADPTMDAINQLLGQSGETSRVLQAEQDAGLPALRNQLVSIQGQIGEELASLRAGQQALEGQGAIRSTAGLTRRQEQLQQQSTNRVLALQSAAEVLQGNISNAENYIARLAQAETENQRNELEARMFNLQQIQRQAERLGDERSALAAEARQLQVNEQLRLLDEQSAERTQAREIALSAIPRGADSTEVANFLAGNPTVADAIARFGQDLQAPTPQEALDMENARLQNAKLLQDISYGRLKEMELSQDILSMGKGLENNPLQQAIVAESIVSTEKILDDPKLPVAVGIVRPIVKGVGYRDFVNSVESLIENLTLEKLASAKETGVTFGALSEGEIGLVAAAATKIGRARDRGRDGKGEVKGYNMSEQAFREEVDTINNFRKLDAVLKGVPMETVGVVQTPDGALWTSNSYGQMVQLR